MNNELLNKINQSFEMCDELDALGYGVGYGNKQRDAQKASFITFVLYFAMADGEITDSDSAFLKDYFDIEMPKEMMSAMYQTMCVDNIVYKDSDYSKFIPADIQSFVMADNKIYASSCDDTKSFAGFTANVYYAIGEELLADSSDAVKEKFSEFMKQIADYLSDNLAYNYSLDF